jgi:hypothetical protein
MRKEEGAQRLTRVFYGLLLHKVFQPIAAFAVPSFDGRASAAGGALFSANPVVSPESSSRIIGQKGWFGRLVLSLQRSRQLQAERIFREYRCPIDNKPRPFEPRSYVGGHHHVAQ